MRVYCESKDIFKDTIVVTDPKDLHHLIDVLRVKSGDSLDVFDGNKEYSCKVTRVSSKALEAKINAAKAMKPNSGIEVTIACAIPKKQKMDYIIEKCSELGVFGIIPLVTERTIVRVEGKDMEHKLIRWRKIAKEAASQSARVSPAVIEKARTFKEALFLRKNFGLALIPNLKPRAKSINEVTRNFRGKSVIAFIGPEGDFSSDEIKLAEKAGFISISLGNLVLKVDTAAIAVSAFFHFLNYEK